MNVTTGSPDVKRNVSRDIVLGEPLDQMLNAACRYSFQMSLTRATGSPPEPGGLVLPSPGVPGTGNVVIRGCAGTGKSTLALQILCEAARRNEDLCAAYISLEETQAHVFEKSREYGWSPYVWPLNRAFPVDAAASTVELASNLREILDRPMACRASGVPMRPIGETWTFGKTPFEVRDCPYGNTLERTCPFRHRCDTARDDHQKLHHNGETDVREFVEHPGIVILPQLLPRPFDPEDVAQDEASIFWARYRQLDDLLRAAEHLETQRPTTNSAAPFRNTRLVCIDSLNVFGAGGLTRDHLAALFDLFKRRQILGILVVEENERGVFAGDSQVDSDTIDFLADMVIRLNGADEQGYWLRHFQILKSRHQKHVLGRHPFKILGQKQSDETRQSGINAVTDLIADVEKRRKEEVEEMKRRSRQAAAEVNEDPPAVDKSLKTLCTHLQEWKIGGEWRRRFPPELGARFFPSVHSIVAASEHLDMPDEGHVHVQEREIWSSHNLRRMVRVRRETGPHVFTVIGPATSGKSLIAGNFLLEGLSWGEDVLLIRFSEKADFTAEGSWSPNPEDSENTKEFNRDWLYRLLPASKPKSPAPEKGIANTEDAHPSLLMSESKHSAQASILRVFLSTFGSQKLQFWIHEYGGPLKEQVSRADGKLHQRARKPLLVEIAVRPGALLPEEFVAIVREVYRWGRHFRQREGFDIRRAALLDVHSIGVGYPLLKHSSTAAELFLSAFTHILRCRKTDFLMTAQTGGVPESESVTRKAVSLADQVITCEHCDVFGDHYITVRGPGLIEGDMVRSRTPESVPGVLRRQKSKAAKFADYFEVDFTTLQGLVGFSSGNIRRPGVSLQLFEVGPLHKAYNSQVARLIRFAMGSAGPREEDSASLDRSRRNSFQEALSNVALGDTPTVTVDAFDSVFANPFHQSLELLKGAPLHNTVLRTIDEFAVSNTLLKDVPKQVQDRFLYAHLYHRNVLLLACDRDTHSILEPQRNNLSEFWHQVVELAESPDFVILCDQRSHETLACLAMDGAVASAQMAGKVDADALRDPLTDYLALMKVILTKAQPLVAPDSPWELSTAARNLAQTWPEYVATRVNQLKADFLSHGNSQHSERVSSALKHLSKSARKQPERQQRYLILSWYSHLRELIAMYQAEMKRERLSREPVRSLVANMSVLGLPGNGFKGDWYLEVPPGSVSESLGNDIKQALLRPEEDLKRFVEGVGLPSWPSKESHFFNLGEIVTLFQENLKDGSTHCRVSVEAFLAALGKDAEQRKKLTGICNDLREALGEKGASDKLRKATKDLCDELGELEKNWKSELSDPSHGKPEPLSDPNLEEFERAYTRFHDLKEAAGVGRESVAAWPGGEVRLDEVMTLHRKANRRSSFDGYRKVRGELYSVMHSLSEGPDSSDDLDARRVEHMISLAIQAMSTKSNESISPEDGGRTT